jgi:hypothetical protein
MENIQLKPTIDFAANA